MQQQLSEVVQQQYCMCETETQELGAVEAQLCIT